MIIFSHESIDVSNRPVRISRYENYQHAQQLPVVKSGAKMADMKEVFSGLADKTGNRYVSLHVIAIERQLSDAVIIRRPTQTLIKTINNVCL